MSESGRKGCDLRVPQCRPFFFPGDAHGVLLIHGFTGSAAHMRLLGEALSAQGFTVAGINLPGHATTMDDMGKESWQTWRAAARAALQLLQAQCRRVSVAGLSMGGVLTLILAEENPAITACAPISAPMAVQNRLLPLAGAASLIMKNIWWRDDPERPSLLDPAYDRGYPGFPTAKGADLSRLIGLARENLSAVRCPIVAVQSHADETISADSADVILKGVSSQRKKALWLEDVPHACTASPAHAGQIARCIGPWFREAERTADEMPANSP